jgi:hypothetical protein
MTIIVSHLLHMCLRFNLPTFYLPRGDDEPPSNIPNAIEEVCKEIDKSINSTVQKNLRLLKDDCERILTRCEAVAVEDRDKRRSNMRSTLQVGWAVGRLGWGAPCVGR